MRNPANKQTNKHTKVIAIYHFSRDNNLGDFDLGDFGIGDFDLGDFGIGDFDLGDFGIGEYDLGDINLGDFDLTSVHTHSEILEVKFWCIIWWCKIFKVKNSTNVNFTRIVPLASLRQKTYSARVDNFHPYRNLGGI